MVRAAVTAPADLSPDPATRFLDGGGRAAALIRARDWSAHPLGEPAGWPEGLRTALSLLVNSPESMILAWGPDLHFFFNDTYVPLLGPRVDWATGARFDEVWAEAMDQARPIIDAAMAGDAQRFTDLPWKLATDRGAADTWWSFSYSRVLDGEGAPAGLFIFTNETTGRVTAEAERRRSERQLARAQAAGQVGVFSVDVATNRTHGSPEFFRLFGLPACGHTTAAAVEACIVDRDLASSDAGRRTRTMPLAATYRIRAADTGELRWIERHAEFETDEAGATWMVGVVQDVTAREAQAAELAELNATLAARVEEEVRERERIWCSTNDLMGTAGTDGYLKRINPAWQRLLGWDEETLLGQPFFAIIEPEDHAETIRVVERLSRGERVDGFLDHLRTLGGGRRAIMWNAVPEGELFHIVGRDVTAQREAEERLRHAQKMEAVGQLTGGIAHDFNNMLTGVIGAMDLLKRQMDQGRFDRVERYIDAATTSAQRAASLTQRLLAFSRRQSLDVRAVDVNALVGGLEELLRRTLGERISLEVATHAGAPAATTDANQLESALLNLAINARDAMPEGGTLRIETAVARMPRDGGPAVAIRVADTGTGMEAAVAARAFDPFFTTKPQGQGTGLGLSMIHGFVHQSGGDVRIDTAPGAGTAITLFLPLAPGAADPADAATAMRHGARDGESVLLVEDDPAVRLLVADVLGDLGYHVRQAVDGQAALPLLEAPGRIDLLVTDVGLPGINGRRLADLARERRPGLPVLFVTGYAEGATSRSGFLGEGMDMIAKPFAIDTLSAKIREMIER